MNNSSDSKKYHVKIVVRDHQGQIKDDYHATVTRRSDWVELIFISNWKWALKWRIRRKALDREFKYYDKRQKKLAKVEELER